MILAGVPHRSHIEKTASGLLQFLGGVRLGFGAALGTHGVHIGAAHISAVPTAHSHLVQT